MNHLQIPGKCRRSRNANLSGGKYRRIFMKYRRNIEEPLRPVAALKGRCRTPCFLPENQTAKLVRSNAEGAFAFYGNRRREADILVVASSPTEPFPLDRSRELNPCPSRA